MSRTYRRPYVRPAEKASASCRPGGSCPYCKGNRFHSDQIRAIRADQTYTDALTEFPGKIWAKVSARTLPGHSK